MKAAFAFCEDRIAPVFDVAQQIYLVETSATGNITNSGIHQLESNSLPHTATLLSELGVEILVCGAISRPCRELVAAYGIKVIAFIAGRLDEVVNACLSDNLDQSVYAMPGCGRGPGVQRRRAGKRGKSNRQYIDNNFCVCPQCGDRQPHRRGIPCKEQKCAQCGCPMTREPYAHSN